MTYNMHITFGHYANSENELEDKIFNPTDTTEIKRNIVVEHEETSDDDGFQHYYFGYASYENVSKQNIKDILNANNENECWTILENGKPILTEDNDKSKIEQWLNEQPEQTLQLNKKSKRRM